MHLLVIGGTRFVGRHMVSAAVARGHQVTLLNRGVTAPEVHPDLPQVAADRDDAATLAALRTMGPWDAVLDCCAYRPAQVDLLLEALAGRGGRYVLVSSISVYGTTDVPAGVDEDDAPLPALHDPAVIEVTESTYGPLKVACEERAAAVDALVIRPGLVIGPWDHTDRFTYWPRRLAEGGRVLAPGEPQRRVQAIDARDLAEFTLTALEDDRTGPFNVVSPPIAFGALLSQVGAVAAFDGELVWVPDSALLAAGVEPFSDLPFWLPSDHNGLLEASGARAASAGLTCRTWEQTTADLLEWIERHDPPAVAGIARDRELALLDELG